MSISHYVLNKKWETIKITKDDKTFTNAEIHCSNNYHNCITLTNKSLNTKVSAVNKINNLIVDKIQELLQDKVFMFSCGSMFQIIKAEDIISIIFYNIKWRRANAYLTIQSSAKGHRIICYVNDNINHNGSGFGTTLIAINKKIIQNVFFTEKKKLIKMLNTTAFNDIGIIETLRMLSFINSINPSNFEQYFGF